MKKKIFFIVLILLVVITAGIVIFFSTRTSQEDLTAERPTGLLGNLAITSPQFVELRPGLVFKIDTGSDYSSITEKDIAFLDSLGYHATVSTYPLVGRNGAGELLYKKERIKVDLPLYKWTSHTDSTGMTIKHCLFNASNVLHNVDFVRTKLPFSVLGIDFLEKFNVEYKASEGLIGLYFNTPDGYEPCATLTPSNSPLNWLTLSHRYYLPVTVDDVTDNYFFDTGTPRAFIKRPLKQLDPDTPHLSPDTVETNRGEYPAEADSDGWIVIGNRQGKHVVYYYDSDEETHSINPLNMFDDIDMLFDFPDQKLYFRK